MKNRAYVLLLLLVFALSFSCFTIVASADEGFDENGDGGSFGDGFSWYFDYESATLTIEGEGVMPSYTSSYAQPWTAYRSSIEHIVIGEGITGIGNYCFAYSSVTEITIPDSVKSIGSDAFSGCSYLQTLVIGAGVEKIGNYAFYYCTSLEVIEYNAVRASDNSATNSIFYNAGKDGEGIAVTVGADVEYIPAYLFAPYVSSNTPYYMPKLTSVTFEEGSKCGKIGEYAFYGCSELASLTMGDRVENIGKKAFARCSSLSEIDLPSSLKIIGDYAFERCTSLLKAQIPSHVTSIGVSAYSDCTALREITVAESVESIGANAFYKCSALSLIKYQAVNVNSTSIAFDASSSSVDIVIGERVENIPAYLFYALNVSDVRFEDVRTCRSIGASAFGFSSMSGGVYINDVSAWAQISFADTYSNPIYYSGKLYIDGSPVTEAVFDVGTKNVGCAFSGLTSLERVTIENGAESIAEGAFLNCTALEYVSLPDTLTSIGPSAFANCASLRELNLPRGLTAIGAYAFSECTSLEYIGIPDSVTTVDSYAFSGCTGVRSIYIGESVTRLGSYAFYRCAAVEDIVYNARALGNLSSNNCVFMSVGTSGVGIELTVGSSAEHLPAYLFCPNSSYPSVKLTSVGFAEGSVCTSIGNGAFRLCDKLERVFVSSSVESIESGAFYGCSSLSYISLPFVGGRSSIKVSTPETCFGYIFGTSSYSGGVASAQYYSEDKSVTYYIPASLAEVEIRGGELFYGAFYSCKNIKTADISGACRIGERAFFGCTSLEELVVGESVSAIGNYAFSDCTSLERIYFDAEWMYALPDENYAFSDAGKNGDGITLTVGKNAGRIPAYLFCPTSYRNANAPRITSVVFEDGSVCESIGKYAFYNCVYIENVSLSDGVADIGEYAFYLNYSMTTLTLGTGLERIGEGAFYKCTAIESVSLPDGVTDIGKYAFSHCTSLRDLYIGVGALYIGVGSFGNCTALERITYNAENAYGFGYGESNGVFLDAGSAGEGITLVIGADVRVIPSYMFNSYHYDEYNPKITTVVFEAGALCTTIGEGAFRLCRSIEKITIPESVVSFEWYIFEGCPSVCLYVTDGSAAHEYAMANSLDYRIVAEDIDGDGEYTNADITLILRYLAGWDITESVAGEVARVLDLDRNGRVNNRDALVCIKRAMLA